MYMYHLSIDFLPGDTSFQMHPCLFFLYPSSRQAYIFVLLIWIHFKQHIGVYSEVLGQEKKSK